MQGSVLTALTRASQFAALLTFLLPTGAAQAASITDFMVMTVCTDAAGALQTSMAPIDPGCRSRRKLLPGEPAPYRLTTFSAANDVCANRQGVVVRHNMPVVVNGVTRIVSYDDHIPRSGCRLSGEQLSYGASIQGTDGLFGFILGDDGPTGQINFESPPICRAFPASARRFSRGWGIGPVNLPSPGGSGFVAMPAVLGIGDPGVVLSRPCPQGGPLALTTWTMDRMIFTGGLTLDALVSDHFSRANLVGTGPGAAQQMERTYWTAEFGLTRWEKWARADWTGGGTPVPALGRAAWATPTCSPPHGMAMTGDQQPGPLRTQGEWSQIMRDARTGQQFTWFLLDCRDYSNIDRTAQSAPPAVPARYLPWWKG